MIEQDFRAEKKKQRIENQQWPAARREARQLIFDTYTAFRNALNAERALIDQNLTRPGQQLTFTHPVNVFIRRGDVCPDGWTKERNQNGQETND